MYKMYRYCTESNINTNQTILKREIPIWSVNLCKLLRNKIQFKNIGAYIFLLQMGN